MFPSPCRGLIFLTAVRLFESKGTRVSVPLQGTYLPYRKIHLVNGLQTFKFPSPCRGLIFLTSKRDFYFYKGNWVSVPLQGTYLPYPALFAQPPPVLQSFRPLAGDLSSLLKKLIADVFDLFTFPSPCRGLIFLTNRLEKRIRTRNRCPSPCRGLIFLTVIF